MFCTPVCKQDYSWRPVGCLCIPQSREKSFKKFQWLFNAWQAGPAAGLCMSRQQENRFSKPLYLLVFYSRRAASSRPDGCSPAAARTGSSTADCLLATNHPRQNRFSRAGACSERQKTVQQKPIGPADPVGRCFPQPGLPEVANCGAVSRSAGFSAPPGAEG